MKQINNFFEIHLIIDSRTMQDIPLKTIHIPTTKGKTASGNYIWQQKKSRSDCRKMIAENKKTEQGFNTLLSFLII
nr:hypothetical protein [uncultured Desulfobacter sp.]